VSPPHPANGASDHAPQGRHPGVLAAADTRVVLLYAGVDDDRALRKLAELLGVCDEPEEPTPMTTRAVITRAFQVSSNKTGTDRVPAPRPASLRRAPGLEAGEPPET